MALVTFKHDKKPPERQHKRGTGSAKAHGAVDLMVRDGLTRKEAAKAVGLNDDAMYRALHNPALRQYLAEQERVLMRGERVRTIYRLIEVRDSANNMPAVNAAKMLLELSDDGSSSASGGVSGTAPGVTIVIESRQPRGELTGNGKTLTISTDGTPAARESDRGGGFDL